MKVAQLKAKSIYDREGGESRTVKPLGDAATVILVRKAAAGGPFELFLMRRQQKQAFMGGAFVFPGGRLETADTDPTLASYCEGLRPADARRLLQEPDLSELTARGLFLAAIRETFEEAGVLLAREEDGRTIDSADPERAARLTACRFEIHEARVTLAELALGEKLRYALDLLVPYSHWITPEAEPRRFDTRFFLAALPEGQIPIHDRMELTESRWMTPEEALAEHAADRIALMPPTLKTIEELAAFPSFDALFAAARAKEIPVILPEIFRTETGVGIRLPNDPQYTGAAFPKTARPGETTRIVMENGIWRTRSGAPVTSSFPPP